MPFNRMIGVGFVLVLIGAIVPFVIVIRLVESTFFLNFIAFAASVIGIFLGVIGTAMHVGDSRRRRENDWYEG
ncbi:hypothetical protein [Candidatus Leptofilum sp.]|uniref:hypothetical protein n=1 Tax=Candidatus Leptofilum sp. TaxID=3241576 RepID=UPI003B59436A